MTARQALKAILLLSPTIKLSSLFLMFRPVFILFLCSLILKVLSCICSFTFILKTAFIFSLETIKISFIVSSISFLYFSIASFTRDELQFSNNVPFDRSAASVFLKYILYSTSFTVPVFSKIFNIFSHNSEALTSIFKLLQKLFVIWIYHKKIK